MYSAFKKIIIGKYESNKDQDVKKNDKIMKKDRAQIEMPVEMKENPTIH